MTLFGDLSIIEAVFYVSAIVTLLCWNTDIGIPPRVKIVKDDD